MRKSWHSGSQWCKETFYQRVCPLGRVCVFTIYSAEANRTGDACIGLPLILEKIHMPPHAHYWVVESAQGKTSRGQCRICGKAKNFYNSFPAQESSRKGLPKHHHKIVVSERWEARKRRITKDPLG